MDHWQLAIFKKFRGGEEKLTRLHFVIHGMFYNLEMIGIVIKIFVLFVFKLPDV